MIKELIDITNALDNKLPNDELIKIEEDKSPVYDLQEKTLDWWDINYRPSEYHTLEEFELFFPIK